MANLYYLCLIHSWWGVQESIPGLALWAGGVVLLSCPSAQRYPLSSHLWAHNCKKGQLRPSTKTHVIFICIGYISWLWFGTLCTVMIEAHSTSKKHVLFSSGGTKNQIRQLYQHYIVLLLSQKIIYKTFWERNGEILIWAVGWDPWKLWPLLGPSRLK